MQEEQQVKILCRIRDIYRSINEFESQFQKLYNISLNEGMLLCTLEDSSLSSSDLAKNLSLSNSNTSKVIKSAEQKDLVSRNLGQQDKRQMYFCLTEKGKELIKKIKCSELEVPKDLSTFIL